MNSYKVKFIYGKLIKFMYLIPFTLQRIIIDIKNPID